MWSAGEFFHDVKERLEWLLAYARQLSVKYALAIIGVAAAVLATSAALNAWVYYTAHECTIALLQQQQADDAAIRISGFIKQIAAEVSWLVEPSSSGTSDDDRRVDALRLLRVLKPVTSLSLIDPQGQEVLVVSRLGPDAVRSGRSFAEDTNYLRAKRRGFQLGKVYFQRE